MWSFEHKWIHVWVRYSFESYFITSLPQRKADSQTTPKALEKEHFEFTSFNISRAVLRGNTLRSALVPFNIGFFFSSALDSYTFQEESFSYFP